jgi:hypothetical protein
MRQALLASIALVLWAGAALAEEPTKIELSIKDHRFIPSEIHIPAGKPAMLTLRNDDATPEEFESSALKAEKVISGMQSVSIRLRPLAPGRFPFIGEYHADTAQGVIVADMDGTP